MADAFYEPRGGTEGGERFRATVHTVGPWDAAHQHAGPPAGLLTRAIQRCGHDSDTDGDGPARLVHRLTVDVLGPIPVADVEVRARVLRPGRRIELVEAELTTGGRLAMRATAWRVRRQATGAPTITHQPQLPPPDGFLPVQEFSPGWVRGYLDAVEWRLVTGRFTELGPATVWARPLVPLVEGEEMTALQRWLVVADSGSGVSACLDLRTWLFVNTDLTVHLHREPSGEWVGMDAQTTVSGEGIGTAATVLHDVHGQVGRSAQALIVTPR